MTIHVPPMMRVSIDQVERATQWSDALGEAIELTRSSIARSGKTLSLLDEYEQIQVQVRVIGRIGQVTPEVSPAPSDWLELNEYRAITSAMLWHICSEIAQCSSNKAYELATALSLALGAIQRVSQTISTTNNQ